MALDPSKLEGRTLGKRYRVVRRIGAGGMGVVFEAVQIDLSRRVALKVLLETDARALARFRQEALATANLSSPHIVSVTDFQIEGDPPFLVMELLEGESLRDTLRTRRRLPIDEALRVAAQILGALATAHRAGIIHRDVKPANVFMVTSALGESIVKLLDFGIAKLAGGGMDTTRGSVLGTPAYLAPEQIDGAELGPAADIHAVGAVLYEMLMGQRLWHGRSEAEIGLAVLREEAPRVRRSGVPNDIIALVARALDKNPAHRFADAGVMLDALREAMKATQAEVPADERRTQRLPGADSLDADDETATMRGRDDEGPVAPVGRGKTVPLPTVTPEVVAAGVHHALAPITPAARRPSSPSILLVLGAVVAGIVLASVVRMMLTSALHDDARPAPPAPAASASAATTAPPTIIAAEDPPSSPVEAAEVAVPAPVTTSSAALARRSNARMSPTASSSAATATPSAATASPSATMPRPPPPSCGPGRFRNPFTGHCE